MRRRDSNGVVPDASCRQVPCSRWRVAKVLRRALWRWGRCAPILRRSAPDSARAGRCRRGSRGRHGRAFSVSLSMISTWRRIFPRRPEFWLGIRFRPAPGFPTSEELDVTLAPSYPPCESPLSTAPRAAPRTRSVPRRCERLLPCWSRCGRSRWRCEALGATGRPRRPSGKSVNLADSVCQLGRRPKPQTLSAVFDVANEEPVAVDRAPRCSGNYSTLLATLGVIARVAKASATH